MEILLHNQGRMTLDRPRIMGVLNLTPDSFSDGGRYADPEQAVTHALAMVEQGADVIDVGGESTRPGAKRVSESEQIARVVPVIRALRQKLDAAAAAGSPAPHDTAGHSGIPVSIDTTRVRVAQEAVEAGATILNDVSAGREDARMLPYAAGSGLPIILMHMLGEPATMQDAPHYGDVVAEVRGFLLERAKAAIDAGVDPKRIVLDPGIGFGKTAEHNLALLRSVDALVQTGYPILIGASRKRFIAQVTQAANNARPGPAGSADLSIATTNLTDERLGGTCAVTAHCAEAGVAIFRVHDVAPNRQAALLGRALSGEM